MTEWKPKQENETWEQYSARQTARIMLLEREICGYRRLIESLGGVKYALDSVLRYHEEFVEGKK